MLRVLFLVMVGAIIGWLTNVLAIKMLFRPIKPVKIPVLNITIQGLIPKRKKDISRSIGEVVEKELISVHDIIERFVNEKNKQETISLIKDKVLKAIDSKIPFIIPVSIKSKIIEYVEEQIDKDAGAILDSTVDGLVSQAVDQIRIGEMVEAKIDEFELEKLENLILNITSKELGYIEILGGVLGGFIGLLQGLIIRFL